MHQTAELTNTSALLLDCLDRTNLIESELSALALNAYLNKLGLPPLIVNPGSIERDHRELVSKNGNDLSKIYTGVGAQFSTFTATGLPSKKDLVLDGLKAAERMFNAMVLSFLS